MAEAWRGSSWAPVAAPGGVALRSRASLPAYTLDGPSCLSASDCWVAMSPTPPQATFGSDVALGHWDGTHMSAVTLPFLGALERSQARGISLGHERAVGGGRVGLGGGVLFSPSRAGGPRLCACSELVVRGSTGPGPGLRPN